METKSIKCRAPERARIENIADDRNFKKKIKKKQIKYFGHFKMHITRIKTILERKIKGSRARGWQRYNLDDSTKRWTNTNLTETMTRARDRHRADQKEMAASGRINCQKYSEEPTTAGVDYYVLKRMCNYISCRGGLIQTGRILMSRKSHKIQ